MMTEAEIGLMGLLALEMGVGHEPRNMGTP